MSWRDRFTREALTRSFAALRIRDYRRWSIAQLLSAAGGAASQVAIAWLVVELGGDGVALGVVTASTMVPTLVLGPFIGAIVDRFSRRGVLVVTAVAQMTIAGVLAGLAFSGALQIWMLAVLSFAHGVAFAADNPARQLLVLDLVGRDRVTSAVSMNEVIINGARVLGPAVAGLLLVFADAAWCFVVNALVFVPSIIVLLGLRLRAQPDRATPVRTSADGAPETAADPVPAAGVPAPGAWRFVLHTPPVRATLLLAICAAAGYNIAVVVPLIVANVFDAEGGTYGLLAVAFGLGALPGAFFSATGPTTPRGGEVRVLALVMGLAVLLSAAAPVLPLLFVGLAVVGAVVMWFIARANALVMLSTPPSIRGRVMGIWAMCLPGSTVLTGLVVGALAEAADPRIAYAVVGAATMVLAAVSWRALGDEPISARAA